MNKKILFITVALGIILGSFVVYLYWKSRIEPIGGAEITVYRKGERIVLDKESPHFEELELACEKILSSAGSFFPLNRKKEFPFAPEEVKNTEWAIELTYNEPIEIEVLLQTGRTTSVYNPSIKVSKVLIPLTGEMSQIEGEGTKARDGYELKRGQYVNLFFFPEIVFYGREWKGLIGSPSNIQKIKDILVHFGITNSP